MKHTSHSYSLQIVHRSIYQQYAKVHMPASCLFTAVVQAGATGAKYALMEPTRWRYSTSCCVTALHVLSPQNTHTNSFSHLQTTQKLSLTLERAAAGAVRKYRLAINSLGKGNNTAHTGKTEGSRQTESY